MTHHLPASGKHFPKNENGTRKRSKALVVVDEVGYTPTDREECKLFWRLIANRYETASTIITSNKAVGDWTELFHDPIIVTGILDRLLHHSFVVNIKGHGFRLREKFGREASLQRIQ